MRRLQNPQTSQSFQRSKQAPSFGAAATAKVRSSAKRSPANIPAGAEVMFASGQTGMFLETEIGENGGDFGVRFFAANVVLQSV